LFPGFAFLPRREQSQAIEISIPPKISKMTCTVPAQALACRFIEVNQHVEMP
jgi:hypothetical protein